MPHPERVYSGLMPHGVLLSSLTPHLVRVQGTGTRSYALKMYSFLVLRHIRNGCTQVLYLMVYSFLVLRATFGKSSGYWYQVSCPQDVLLPCLTPHPERVYSDLMLHGVLLSSLMSHSERVQGVHGSYASRCTPS